MEGDEESESITEEREEMMMSTDTSTCRYRIAKFLKPCITFLFQAPKPPPLSHLSEPISHDPELLLKGWRRPQKQWIQWVDELVPLYGNLWTELGIHDAIKSSTFIIYKDPDLVMGLLEFWCSDTNTFVFPWGEATITLEDVLILAGHPVTGKPVTSPLSEQLLEIQNKLVKQHTSLRKSKAKRASFGEWMSHYRGRGTEMEHIAFLSCWLSMFVFPNHPENTLGKLVFPVAIHLAQGTHMALAPAVLASLYRDLRLLKENIWSSQEQSVTVWGPFQLLKTWACEHFPSLSSDGPNSLRLDEPRAARWHNLKLNSELENVKAIINTEENFTWRPYTSIVNNWRGRSFYKERDELLNVEGENEELLSFACCLKASNIVGLDGTREKYLPHRVARQFGFDQDIPGVFLQSNLEEYDMSLKNVKGLVRSRFIELNVTKRYHEWWTNTISCPGSVNDIKVKAEISKYNEKGEVSVERKMLVRDFDVPPGFSKKMGILSSPDGLSSASPRAERVNGDIPRADVIHEEKTKAEILPFIISDGEEKINTISPEDKKIIKEEINTLSHQEKKVTRDGNSVCILVEDEEKVNMDGAMVSGEELEARITKLEVLLPELKRRFGSIEEQMGRHI